MPSTEGGRISRNLRRRASKATANATSAPAMAALTKLVPISQITYGSDYPYFPLDQITNLRRLGLTEERQREQAHSEPEELRPQKLRDFRVSVSSRATTPARDPT